MKLDPSTGYGFISGLVVTFIVYLNVIQNRGNATNVRTSLSLNTNHTFKVPRILCWVPTMPSNYRNRTLAVQETWGPNCDVILFFSEISDNTIPVIGLGIPEKRRYLARKTMAALQYIFKHYYDKADWFLKADDDTYVIVNNLRHFLLTKDSNAPFYYGSVFRRQKIDLAYNSGGGGYVISRKVLKTLAEKSELFPECRKYVNEDMHIGYCLKALGVVPGSSTDERGLEVFHWSTLNAFLNGLGDAPVWVRRYQSFWAQHQPNSGSEVSATFHYIDPDEMRAFHFILNDLTAYGYVKAKYTIRKR